MLISDFSCGGGGGGGGAYCWLSFYESNLNLTKNFADVSITEKIQNFDDFSGFCCPEFDSFLRDFAIFRSKCIEQHSSILRSQIKY